MCNTLSDKMRAENRRGSLGKSREKRMLRTLIPIPGVSPGHQGLLEAYDALKGRNPKGSYRDSRKPQIPTGGR